MKLVSRVSYSIWKRLLNTQLKKPKSLQWIQPEGFKTDISLYNPLLKSKIPLILRNKNVVTWYMCGPTLYDSAHIGHASTYVRFDTIRRIMSEFFNLDVILIMGLTDIDDKIIRRAIDSNQPWKNVTKFYEEEFFKDMKSLNVATPYMSCRVTDHIPQIIEFVDKILKKGAAYVAQDGSVYFDTLKYGKYGKFNRIQLETPNADKKSSSDFALWKASKRNEPFWESPWGNGRPGWHIECSVMASNIFGNNIDIHSGGVDLVFPHHENEEAQSCCYHDTDQWINYWIHAGHLYEKGDVKMSKSLKNTISIESFLEKYTANQFRMLCLMTNYRRGIEFSDGAMQNAVSTLKKIQNFISDCDNYVAGKQKCGCVDESSLLLSLNDTRNRVLESLADDFNTFEAIQSIVELVGIGNKMLNQDWEVSHARSTTAVATVSNYLTTVLSKLGLLDSTNLEGTQFNLTQVVETFVKFRESVRSKALEDPKTNKEVLKACDEARNNLIACGIQIKDQKNTSSWSLVKN
ncbi:probable cysteine--tRNA ligase, mitochondrial [Belonocnema kinseyi]|uniref:probable cysteine--tRNA ligase, mitochondrial n=1 Tax=Belonocnema kinseyi TaxID=2817044 RepID=UPI00143DCC84|nr:probable cysteine--tRNA ligase, mitochondrial [Belonocnema kinseyi]